MPEEGFHITDERLPLIADATGLAGGTFEVGFKVGTTRSSKRLPVGTLLQVVNDNLPGPNLRPSLQQHVRYLSSTAPGFGADGPDSSLDTLDENDLCLNATCSVEFENGQQTWGEYVVRYDETGPLRVWRDGTFRNGGKVPARWVRRDSAAATTQGIPAFNPAAVRLAAGAQVVYNSLIFEALQELRRADFGNNQLPLPTDVTYYKEISRSTPQQAEQTVGHPLLRELMGEDQLKAGRWYRVTGRGDGLDVLVEGLNANSLAGEDAYTVPAGADAPVLPVRYDAVNNVALPRAAGGANIEQISYNELLFQADDADYISAGRTYWITDRPNGPETVYAEFDTTESRVCEAARVAGLPGLFRYDLTTDELTPLESGITEAQAVTAVANSGLFGRRVDLIACAVVYPASGGTPQFFQTAQQACDAAAAGDQVHIRGTHSTLDVRHTLHIVAYGARFTGQVVLFWHAWYAQPSTTTWRGGTFEANVFLGRNPGNGLNKIRVWDARFEGPSAFIQSHTNNTDNPGPPDQYSFTNCHLTHVAFNQLNAYNQTQALYFSRCVFKPHVSTFAIFRGAMHSASLITAHDCRFEPNAAGFFDTPASAGKVQLHGLSTAPLDIVTNLLSDGLRVVTSADPFAVPAGAETVYPAGGGGGVSQSYVDNADTLLRNRIVTLESELTDAENDINSLENRVQDLEDAPASSGGGGGIDYTQEIVHTASATLTSAALSKSHVLSGNAPLTLTLPAPAPGQRISVRVDRSSTAVHTVLVAGSGLVDGGPARALWAQESMQMVALSGGEWQSTGGRRRPMRGHARRGVGQGFSFGPNDFAQLPLTEPAQAGLPLSVSAGGILVRRSGFYTAATYSIFSNCYAGQLHEPLVRVGVAGGTMRLVAVGSLVTSGTATDRKFAEGGIATAPFFVEAGEIVELAYYTQEGLMLVVNNPSTLANLAITEVLD